jgi:TrmH family RNA methyltransferase
MTEHPITVVLVGTTHPGNLGAAARAMKTMGLADLRLAAPACEIDDTARATSVHADDVLAGARVFPDLPAALADCHRVFGLSARIRRLGEAPATPREAAADAVATAHSGPVALVFGSEHSGLTNDELARCHRLVHIPANPEYSSLNLAAAVQIMAYEVRLACGEQALPEPGADASAPLASGRHLESFYGHLARTIELSGYADTAEDPQLMLRLRRLFNRARPEHREINILRGLLVAVERRLGRGR